MLITQKTRYGLRAAYELAAHYGEGPLKIGEIANAQVIPHRFLETILRELKQGGMVSSRRGNAGGYILLRPPSELCVEDIISVLQGPVTPVECISCKDPIQIQCDLYGKCAFMPMWEELRDAVHNVFRKTTFESLLKQANAGKCGH